MRQGWRELRVYISAHPHEMQCVVDEVVSLCLHQVRSVTDARRIKVLPVYIPDTAASGGREVSVVGRLREMQRCHAVILVQGSEYASPIDLYAHLHAGAAAGAGGASRQEGEAGDGAKGVGGRWWRGGAGAAQERVQQAEAEEEREREREEEERERHRVLKGLYDKEEALSWLLHYNKTDARYAYQKRPVKEPYDTRKRPTHTYVHQCSRIRGGHDASRNAQRPKVVIACCLSARYSISAHKTHDTPAAI